MFSGAPISGVAFASLPSSSGGATNNLTLTATQGSAATLARAIAALRSATQAQSAALVRGVNAIRSATQASAATLTALKVKLLTLTATVAQSAVLVRAVSITRSCTQASVAVVARLIGWTRALTQGATATLTAIKVKILTLFATQGAVAMLARSVGVAHSATQVSSASIAKAIAVTRSASASAIATLRKSIGKTFTAIASGIASLVGAYLPGGSAPPLVFDPRFYAGDPARDFTVDSWQGAFMILSAKDPAETITVTFNYAEEHPGATLAAPSVTASVASGTDGSPSAILSGAAQVQGQKILQSIIGGLPFVDYKLRCTAMVNGTLISVRAAVLPVRTL